MVRIFAVLAFLAISGATALAWRAPAPGGVQQPKPDATDRLRETIDFEGFVDPKLTLEGALEYLTDRYEINFDVDECAFMDDKEDKENKQSILDEPIATRPIPKMFKVTLEHVLKKILSRLPTPSGATYLFRGNTIEITTRKAAAKEVLGSAELPLPPLVTKKIEKRVLSDALDDVSKLTGVSVVLDVSEAETAKKPVSAKFMNVPIDTAVKLLADMADLGTIRLDNALYVTTRDKAKALRKEQQGSRKKPMKPRSDD
jgi:hypothetical protein